MLMCLFCVGCVLVLMCLVKEIICSYVNVSFRGGLADSLGAEGVAVPL